MRRVDVHHRVRGDAHVGEDPAPRGRRWSPVPHDPELPGLRRVRPRRADLQGGRPPRAAHRGLGGGDHGGGGAADDGGHLRPGGAHCGEALHRIHRRRDRLLRRRARRRARRGAEAAPRAAAARGVGQAAAPRRCAGGRGVGRQRLPAAALLRGGGVPGLRAARAGAPPGRPGGGLDGQRGAAGDGDPVDCRCRQHDAAERIRQNGGPPRSVPDRLGHHRGARCCHGSVRHPHDGDRHGPRQAPVHHRHDRRAVRARPAPDQPRRAGRALRDSLVRRRPVLPRNGVLRRIPCASALWRGPPVAVLAAAAAGRRGARAEPGAGVAAGRVLRSVVALRLRAGSPAHEYFHFCRFNVEGSRLIVVIRHQQP
mmetsp:Transcript_1400/g.3958  ORF Transcript_1400/g.3958 Transcript_1400/m.3958 type:complete len:368 (+) Transcript_1400:203-1306(+)